MKTIMLQGLALVLFGLLHLGPNQVRSHPQAPAGPRFFGQSGAAAIKHMGYIAESYSIRSDQAGYVLGVNRMINPLANPNDVKRAILFHHGFTQDSVGEFLGFAGWARPEKPTAYSYSTDIYRDATDNLDPKTQEATVETYKNLCMPCMFSNNNYDVYIMDYRGVSTASSQFDEKDFELRGTGKKKNYWDFSLDETTFFDLPAVIDFVREKSGQQKISYVGFSLGTLDMFALLSVKPEWADKIEANVAIGPVFYLNNMRGLFPLLALTDPLLRRANFATLSSFNGSVKFNKLLSFICGPAKIRLNLCLASFENLVTGPDKGKLNIFTDAYLSHFLEPYSIKTFVHVAQIIKTGKFSTFNHADSKDNVSAYNSETPLDIEPKKMTHKKMIYVRSESDDFLSNKKDQEQFISELTVPIFEDIVTPPEYNHISFFVAKTCFTQVFGPIMRAVNRSYETEL